MSIFLSYSYNFLMGKNIIKLKNKLWQTGTVVHLLLVK